MKFNRLLLIPLCVALKLSATTITFDYESATNLKFTLGFDALGDVSATSGLGSTVVFTDLQDHHFHVDVSATAITTSFDIYADRFWSSLNPQHLPVFDGVSSDLTGTIYLKNPESTYPITHDDDIGNHVALAGLSFSFGDPVNLVPDATSTLPLIGAAALGFLALRRKASAFSF